MAKATYTPAVTETKTVEVEPAKVALELTVAEAKHLAALLGACNSTNVSAFYKEEVDNFKLYRALEHVVEKAGHAVPYSHASIKGGSIRYVV